MYESYSSSPKKPQLTEAGIKKIVKWSVIGILAILILKLVFGSFYTVKTGNVGVLYSFGKLSRVVEPGINFKTPFVDSVRMFDTTIGKEEVSANAASKDLQNSTTTVAINYSVDRDNVESLIKTVGWEYKSRIIDPAIQESVKSVTARYSAEELIQKRELIKDEIKAILAARVQKDFILVHEVSITNFQFSGGFNAAIEAKQTAVQEALAAKNALERVKYEAEQKIATARAEAETIKIQSEAITKQGGQEYVMLQLIKTWDGKACTSNCYGSGTNLPIPFMSVGK